MYSSIFTKFKTPYNKNNKKDNDAKFVTEYKSSITESDSTLLMKRWGYLYPIIKHSDGTTYTKDE